MNHHEFRASMDTLRQAGSEVEKLLGVSAGELSRWERGAAKVPRVRARQIRWLLRSHENIRLRAAAGLPVCAWADSLTQRFEEKFAGNPNGEATLEDIREYDAELKSHQNQCPTCASNKAWAQEHLHNPGPFPVPGLWGVVFGLVARVPQPFHLALIGAVLLGGVVALRLVFVVAVVIFRFPGPKEALLLLADGVFTVVAAAAAGAAGGLVIPVTAPLRRGLGMVGDYLTGILVMQAYMWALAGLLPLAFGDSADLGGWESLTIFAAVFGVIGAFIHRRNERKELDAVAASHS